MHLFIPVILGVQQGTEWLKQTIWDQLGFACVCARHVSESILDYMML